MKLCECGCGQETGRVPFTWRKRGMVRGQSRRFLPGHHMRTAEARERVAKQQRGRVKRTPALERFARLVGEPDENGCLPWLGCRLPEGHGFFRVGNTRRAMAHRFAYEQARGSIPEGHHLHHVCGNSWCVNPEHLEPMTPSDHSRLHHELHNLGRALTQT